MGKILITRVEHGSTIDIKVQPEDLLSLRKHLKEMVYEEVIKDAKAMAQSEKGVNLCALARKYKCTYQFVKYILEQAGLSVVKTFKTEQP